MPLQSLIQAIYPPQCILCDARTDDDFALCGSCWAQTPFTEGLVCDTCGAPLPGLDDPDETEVCDDCLAIPRPWSKGRAAMLYSDLAKRIVLSLKHGDRLELARAAAPWMARSGGDFLMDATAVLVPVPLHRFRLLKRTYNQAALLAQAVGGLTGHAVLVDALVRTKQTDPLQGHTLDQRFEALSGAIAVNPRVKNEINGKTIVLIDDVMTSGATFAACAEVCRAAGAKDVHTLALARVAKDA